MVSSYKPFFIGLMFRIFRPSFVGKEWWWRENYGNVVVLDSGGGGKAKQNLVVVVVVKGKQWKGGGGVGRGNSDNFSTEAHAPTPWYGQYLTHVRNHITPAVAAVSSSPRREQKHYFKRQLHRRQVLAVGWELQNSSPTECVWRTKNTLNKFPAKIDGLPVEGHKEKSFPGSSPI